METTNTDSTEKKFSFQEVMIIVAIVGILVSVIVARIYETTNKKKDSYKMEHDSIGTVEKDNIIQVCVWDKKRETWLVFKEVNKNEYK